MNIEEKAKAYDSMFERLKEMYNNNKTNVAEKIKYERYFPELKESEDEIRKEIIDFLRLPHPQFVGKRDHEQWIAWLEKQGEQKSVEWSEKDEKQRRQIERIVSNDGCTKKLQEQIHNWFESLKDRIQPQPKQEWSEEDIKALNRISSILVDASEVKNWWKEYRLIEREEMIKLNDFLKSLIYRIPPQPAEWSKEDERERNHCIDFLNHPDMIKATPTIAKGCKEWLKSLRPQKNNWERVTKEIYFKEPVLVRRKDKSDAWEGYRVCNDYTLNPQTDECYILIKDINNQRQWKPSEEQIMALRWVLNNIPYDSHKEEINGLLEQLLKLL